MCSKIIFNTPLIKQKVEISTLSHLKTVSTSWNRILCHDSSIYILKYDLFSKGYVCCKICRRVLTKYSISGSYQSQKKVFYFRKVDNVFRWPRLEISTFSLKYGVLNMTLLLFSSCTLLTCCRVTCTKVYGCKNGLVSLSEQCSVLWLCDCTVAPKCDLCSSYSATTLVHFNYTLFAASIFKRLKISKLVVIYKYKR